MNLSLPTPTQLAAHATAGTVADANFLTDKLSRLRQRFALAHARHQLALDLEDQCATVRGTVSVTVSGPTGALTFDGYDLFHEAGALAEGAGQAMEKLKVEILDVLEDLHEEGIDYVGTDAQRELFALCLPQAPSPTLVLPLHTEAASLAHPTSTAA